MAHKIHFVMVVFLFNYFEKAFTFRASPRMEFDHARLNEIESFRLWWERELVRGIQPVGDMFFRSIQFSGEIDHGRRDVDAHHPAACVLVGTQPLTGEAVTSCWVCMR